MTHSDQNCAEGPEGFAISGIARGWTVDLSRSALLRLVWPAALLGTIVLASGGQVASVGNIPDFDKLAHVLLFGLLATHLCRYPDDPALRLSRTQGLFAIIVTTAFGLSDELHQATNPYRTFDFLDLLADLAGATLATFVYQLWPAYRRLLETPLRLRRRSAG